MKQSRRQELKTNELSMKLQELYQKASRYSTHILVVVLALVVIVLVTNYTRGQRATQLEDASAALLEASRLNPMEEEDNALARARQLVAEYGELEHVGLQARDLLGRMAFQRAQLLNPLEEKDEHVELLKEAQRVYEAIITKHADNAKVVAEARMMLAKINESLVVAGEGDADQVREIYAKLIENESGTFRPLAEEALATLDERLAPLRLVEPGSPETQPARNPIPPDEPDEQVSPDTQIPTPELVPAIAPAPAAEEEAEPIAEDEAEEEAEAPGADTSEPTPEAATEQEIPESEAGGEEAEPAAPSTDPEN